MLACALPMLIVCAGCAGPGDVQGTVSYRPNGKKVVTGTVMFMGADGMPHYAMINADGTYLVRGVPPGPAKVTVASPNPVQPPEPKRPGGGDREQIGEAKPPVEGGAAGVPVSEEIKKNWFAIPEKYTDLQNSGLRFEVKRGVSIYDIVLD